MSRRAIPIAILAIASLAAVAGCGGREQASSSSPEAGATASPSERGARLLPVPSGSARGVAEPAPDARGLAWKAPAGWVEEAPSSAMRKAQYRVSGPEADAECVVFYFGPGQGGDADSNVRRWAGQFRQPDGRPTEDILKTYPLEAAAVPILVVEITGTYEGGMAMAAAPAEPQPGWMLLGAIAEGQDANWFFKLTGPEPTVRAQRAAFEGMLRSLEVSP